MTNVVRPSSLAERALVRLSVVASTLVRVVEDGSAAPSTGRGDRHPLSLAAGQGQAALADERVEPVGERVDELAEARAPGLELVVRRVPARVGDVVAERRRVQERPRTPRPPGRAAGGVDERTSAPSRGRCPRRCRRAAGSTSRACSCRTRLRPRATVGLNREVDVAEHRLATAVVGESHVAELRARRPRAAARDPPARPAARGRAPRTPGPRMPPCWAIPSAMPSMRIGPVSRST